MASDDSSFCHVVNGLLVPKFILQEQVDKLKDFQLFPDDVWVVTYPKCGTTWTQQLVRLIRSKGEQDGMNIFAASPWLEALGLENESKQVNLSLLPHPRVYKSHFPYNLLPCGPPHTTPCKYIYVARNPKDTAVSQYHHAKISIAPNLNWDTFWKQYIEGNVPFGDYFDHHLSWWSHRNDENVLFLKYEAMKANPQQTISDIASFIGVNLTGDVVAKIADLTSFEKMKMDNTVNYSWFKLFNDEQGKPAFMRKGIVGDWKNFLTAEQSSQMDEICSRRFEGTGLEFKYE